jgi:hypothetical protein
MPWLAVEFVAEHVTENGAARAVPQRHWFDFV